MNNVTVCAVLIIITEPVSLLSKLKYTVGRNLTKKGIVVVTVLHPLFLKGVTSPRYESEILFQRKTCDYIDMLIDLIEL